MIPDRGAGGDRHRGARDLGAGAHWRHAPVCNSLEERTCSPGNLQVPAPLHPCRVLVVHDEPAPYIDEMRARHPGVPIATCTHPAGLRAALAETRPTAVLSIKCPGIPAPAHRPILDQPEVRWIHTGGVGVEHLHPWEAARVTVTNSGGVLAHVMAQTVIGAMLMLNFGFHRYLHQQRRRQWRRHGFSDLRGQTALVIGLGHIGRRVAAEAKHHGMTVIGVRKSAGRAPEVDRQVTLDALPDVLPLADFVCLHVPLTGDTRGVLGAGAFARMRPGAKLVNTARGGVVDEAALVDALEHGPLESAYMDVFETEPLPPDSPLWGREDLVISPHVADSVAQWPSHFARFFSGNLERFMAGEPMHNVIDVTRGY